MMTDYRRAFKIACDLLNGAMLYGVDADKIFEIMMTKDGVVSNDSYESYILNNLQELDRGQYASGPTTKNDLGVDCIDRKMALDTMQMKWKKCSSGDDAMQESIDAIREMPTVTPQPCEDAVSRQEVLDLIADYDLSMGQVVRGIHALPSITPQEPRWIFCSERLPEPNRLVLCYITTGTTETYYLALRNEYYDDWEEGVGGSRLLGKDLGYKVLAWMPLPKAYEPQESVG